jgi:hypothetical protein
MADAGFGGEGPITVEQDGRWIGPTNNVANVVEAEVSEEDVEGESSSYDSGVHRRR